MNLTPIPPLLAGVAGGPLSQTKAADAERTQQESAAQQRQVQSDAKAESASGIGMTEEQSGADADRDADGRRLWEAAPDASRSAVHDDGAAGQRQSRDATGQCGKQLDLSG